MADQKQVEILKQGVEVWNKWREQNSSREIDLSGEDLSRLELQGINLANANLLGVHLGKTHLDNANLSGAKLNGVILDRTYLIEANFSGTNLDIAHLNQVILLKANLCKASLIETIFSGGYLIEADFSEANLMGAQLRGTNLVDTCFANATVGYTVFSDVNLTQATGLDKVEHRGPSTVGTDTIQKSVGRIPIEFLRRCGLSDSDIEYARLYTPDLSNQEIDEILYKIHDLRAHQSLQVSPLFISYSHADAPFVDRLEIELNAKGIRFWRDIHDATAGRLEKQIEQAIRHNPTVLVVLSKNSTASDWVQHEVRKARSLEKELGRDVLCPVALDDSWKTSPWPERVMEQVMEYNILDFSEWKDEKVFEKMFVKLLDGLQLFYKSGETP